MEILAINRRELLLKTGILSAVAAVASGCDSTEMKRKFAETVMGTPGEMLMDGKAWAFFCDTLKKAGDAVLDPQMGDDELTRAEGYRFLVRLLGLGTDMLLEYKNPENPAFFKLQGAHRKFAGDNPDQYYDVAIVSSDYNYLVRGTMRDTILIEAGLYAGSFTGDNQQRRLVAFRDESEIELDENGDFELVLSAMPQPGNWIPMESGADSFLVRRYFADPLNKQQQPLTIQRTDAAAPTPRLTAEAAGFGLLGAAKFVEGNARIWSDWTADIMARRPNQLEPMVDSGDIQTPGGVKYLQGGWFVEEDEKLVIRFREPEVPYWGFLIMNPWMESLDFRFDRVTLNKFQAIREPDETVEIVVAHRDPGHPNWINTTGHTRGTMSLRVARLEGELPGAKVSLSKLEI